MEDTVDNEYGAGAYKKLTSQQKVKLLYQMIFPYRQWNDDYLNVCYDIRREVRNWCKKREMRIPLLMIGRAVGLTYDEKTPLIDLCTQILDNIMDICLTEDMTYQSSSLVISYKTNQPPRTDVSSLCKQFMDVTQSLQYRLLDLYEILPVDITVNLEEVIQIAGTYREYPSMKISTVEEDRIDTNKYEQLIEELKDQNLTYDFVKDNIDWCPWEEFPTYQSVMFLLYLQNVFRF